MGQQKKVHLFFANKAAEVRSLVVKLQQTQRAAEVALEKFVSSVPMVGLPGDHPMLILCPGMKRRAQNRCAARQTFASWRGPGAHSVLTICTAVALLFDN